MGEDADLAPHEPEAEVLGADDQPRERVAARVAEHERAARVLRRGAEQPLVVWVAADDAVQHDDVGGRDRAGIDGDVVQPPLDAVLHPGLAREARRLGVIGGRELEVDGAPGAPAQQLEPDLSDPAADLEHRGARDPLALEEADHPLRGGVEPALAVRTGHPPREAPAEEPVAAPRVAAARHDRSLPQRTPPQSGALSRIRGDPCDTTEPYLGSRRGSAVVW
jgi:hypothetical protein